MQGFILEVSARPAGDELDVDHLAGATSLQLADVTDFANEDGTGSLEINGTVYPYSSVDTSTNVVTILNPLVQDELTGERVNLSPLVVEKWAMVELQENEDVVLALVPHSLYDRLDEGIREPEDQEPVIIEMVNGDHVVADVIGSQPKMTGEFTDPVTVAIPPEVQLFLDELAAQVADNTENLANAQGDIQNVALTASSAIDLAATADGRISISDYEPGPEDVEGRIEGSMWFVRTRNRRNYNTNPSFEVNNNGWSATEASFARVTDTAPVDGVTVLEVTNSGVAAPHRLDYAAASPQPAQPGEIWSSSVYSRLVSGLGLGWQVEITYLNSSLTPIAIKLSDPFDITSDWSRLYTSFQAPDNTAFVTSSVVAPTGMEGSVYRVDGALLEISPTIDRYFDGSSYDGVWDGTPENSTSTLTGGKIVKLFELDNGAWVLKQFMGDTLKDVSASDITTGFMDGERIQDYSIPMDKMSAIPVTCAEDVVAGDLVHIVNNAGSAVVYKADADALRACHGFVLESKAAGQVVKVYSHGYNPLMAGLTPGPTFLSTTPGAATNSPPITAGRLSQRVGFAVSPNVMNFVFSPAVRLT